MVAFANAAAYAQTLSKLRERLPLLVPPPRPALAAKTNRPPAPRDRWPPATPPSDDEDDP